MTEVDYGLPRVANWRSVSVMENKDRKAIKRILERLGFVHIAGWVRKEDAPKIRARIEAARADVEKVRDDEISVGVGQGYS